MRRIGRMTPSRVFKNFSAANMRILFEYPITLDEYFLLFHSLKLPKNKEKSKGKSLFIGIVRRFIKESYCSRIGGQTTPGEFQSFRNLTVRPPKDNHPEWTSLYHSSDSESDSCRSRQFSELLQ